MNQEMAMLANETPQLSPTGSPALEPEEDEEIFPCSKCHLIECCCEADQQQVIEDDQRATRAGFMEVNGRWIKPATLFADYDSD